MWQLTLTSNEHSLLEPKGHIHQADHIGTSTNGQITAAKAAPEFIPKTATVTAMASSKLLLAAVKARVVVFG